MINLKLGFAMTYTWCIVDAYLQQPADFNKQDNDHAEFSTSKVFI